MNIIIIFIIIIIVGDFITGHLYRQRPLYYAQHSFLNGNSCLSYLCSVVNAVTLIMDDMEDVKKCFLTFSKAFDIVSQRLLCAKHATLDALP